MWNSCEICNSIININSKNVINIAFGIVNVLLQSYQPHIMYNYYYYLLLKSYTKYKKTE